MKLLLTDRFVLQYTEKVELVNMYHWNSNYALMNYSHSIADEFATHYDFL